MRQAESDADTSPGDAVRLTLAASIPIICGLLLLLAICASAAYMAVVSQTQATDAIKATRVSSAANTLRVMLLSAESAERGYLLTPQQAYRALYQAALPDIEFYERTLSQLVGKDPHYTALIVRVQDGVARKRVEMQHVFALADAGQRDAAMAVCGSQAAMQLMIGLLGDLDAVRRDAMAERETASHVQSDSTAKLIAAIGFAALGALLMAVLAVLRVRGDLRLLRQRERQLDQLVDTLEARVAQRTAALEQTNQRFQIALESSQITVFSQDANLVYDWVSRDLPNVTAAEMIGSTDADHAPPGAVPTLDRIKRGVLASGEPARTEIRMDYPTGARWYDVTLVPTRNEAGEVDGLVGGAVNISERKQYEAHVRLLLREITHRSKNLLAVIQAIMRQTASHAPSVQEFGKRFSARLDALAGSLDLLVQEDWRGVTLADLVRSQLAHHVEEGASQIELDGGKLQLPPDAAQNIGMALHELATNASKYGALSVPCGRVHVSWRTWVDADGVEQCQLHWEERGGPPVTPPARRGFGQVVIERTVARAVGGRVTLNYPPSGVQWTLEFPLRTEAPVEANIS
jgi:two-component sensor histidine kinase/CHASE3 domain sensor protein